MERLRAKLASGNPHKLAELRAALPDWEVELLGADRFPPEEEVSYYENARAKARFGRASGESDGWMLGEDSGLEVDALGGFPGVHSNRWAGPGKSDEDRVDLLLQRLAGFPEAGRGARFICVVAVVTPDGEERSFPGHLDGRLAESPRGSGGFGYDPIMYVPELGRTVAELSAEEKNATSHRAKAVMAAKPWLLQCLENAALIRAEHPEP